MPTTEFRIVCRIGEIIASGGEFHDTLRAITEAVATGVGSEVCNILIHDEDTGKLILEATHGFGQDAVHGITRDPDEGIVGHCFQSLETINTPCKQQHPNFRAFETDAAGDYCSLLAVPLVAGGRAIGVLNLERRVATAFPPKVVAMAQAIAAPIAAFARNRSLWKKLQAGRGKPTRERAVDTVLEGTPITPGVVRGQAYFLVGASVFDRESPARSDDPEAELVLFRRALAAAREDTVDLQHEASRVLAEADAAIFYAHLVLLEDPTLLDRTEKAIRDGLALRTALKQVYREFREELARVDSALVLERLADLKDVILRIFQAADEVEGVAERPASMRADPAAPKPIVVVHELLPSQLIRLPLADLAGIICEAGGTTSHVALLAKALQIPMIVGVTGATKALHTHDDLIMDCTTGNCYVRPSGQVLERFATALEFGGVARELPEACALPLTADGQLIRVAGNISLLNELPLLHRFGASGVGLYRTEFMFMIRNAYPSEEEQFGLFRRIVQSTQGGSVTIRLLDVGGDKPLPYVDFGDEENPMLGWRGMRFLLSNPHYLEPHLRAILRTTVYGRVNILLPMVADVEELLAVRGYLQQAEERLTQAGIPFEPNYRLGVMLEVPSAMWALPMMMPHIDFVSMGTNDLVQYTFAVDRGNPRVNQWFRQFHPISLRMISQACNLVAEHPGKALSVCGEIAGNPVGVPLLLGAGVRFLSMNPWRIPKVVDSVCRVALSDCEALFQQAVVCERDADVVALMHAFAHQRGILKTPDPGA